MKEKIEVTGVPETIEIRSRFLEEKAPIYQISKSAMDISYTDSITYKGKVY